MTWYGQAVRFSQAAKDSDSIPYRPRLIHSCRPHTDACNFMPIVPAITFALIT